MTVEGTLSEQEFVRLNRWLLYRKPAIIVLHVLILVIGLVWSSREGLQSLRGLMSWSPLIIPVVLFFMVSHRSRLQYRKNRTLQSHVRYTVSEEGLDLETSAARARLPWAEIGGLTKTPRHLIVYGSKGQAFVVSASWFSGPDSLRAFVDALQGGMGKGPTGASP